MRTTTARVLVLAAIASGPVVAAAPASASACSEVVQTSHRGLGWDENTVAAFQRAVGAGMSAVETDLRMTRDHQFVLMHDAGVQRTTDGVGRVSAMTWGRFQHLRTHHGQHPPALGEMLGVLAHDSAPPEVQLELKVRVHGRALTRLAALLRSYGVTRVIVTSPQVAQLLRVQRALPGVRTGLISFAHLGRPQPSRVVRAGVDYVMVSRAAASPAYVAAARAQGVRVSARFADVAQAARIGIDRVLTDRPRTC